MQSEMEVIREYIRDEIGYHGAIQPDVDLIERDILDSFSVVEVAMFIQRRFGIELEAEDLVRANLCSLANMTALIARKKKEAGLA